MQDLYCDICGKTPVRAQILVEGAKMLACVSCMRSGKVIHRFSEAEPPSEMPSNSVMESSEEVIEGYGKTIRAARERLTLPLKVVGERIRESESFLHAIENERLAPTIDVARKLEKELGVRLIEKVAATVAPSTPSSKSFTPPTLADMIETKKKKGK
jgi:putative transcription factor